jgi:hypothetical protein
MLPTVVQQFLPTDHPMSYHTAVTCTAREYWCTFLELTAHLKAHALQTVDLSLKDTTSLHKFPTGDSFLLLVALFNDAFRLLGTGLPASDKSMLMNNESGRK